MSLKRELIPMRDEPEKEARANRWMLRMNEDPHEQFGRAHLGRDERVCDQQSRSELRGGRTGSCVRIRGAGFKAAAVSSAEQRAEGHRERFFGQDQRLESSATHSLDPALDGDATD
jgi:hypothetical protein